MRPHGSAEELERRRQRAVALVLGHEYTTAEAAEAVGVTIRSVQKWVASCQVEGHRGLAPTKAAGRPPVLTAKNLEKLEKILLKGPVDFGFENDLWTCEGVGEVIADKFGVQFHRSHIWRIFQDSRWTPQKPGTYGCRARREGYSKVC